MDMEESKMTQISAEQARREFSTVLSRASAGEEIIITRRGKAIVKLSAAGSENRFPDLTAFRNSLTQPEEGQEAPSETVISMRKDYRY
jgi:prevent-host-death family protein